MPIHDRHADAVAVLRTVRDLFRDPGRWVSGQLAVDKYGGSVNANDPHAFRWCAAGAIAKVAHERYAGSCTTASEVELVATEVLRRSLAHGYFTQRDIPHVNDGPNGYERIMAGLAKAIGLSPKRREAALKGWATRRANQQHQAWLREQEAASVDPRPELMVFGGTITVSPVAEKERTLA